jgi:transaldolase
MGDEQANRVPGTRAARHVGEDLHMQPIRKLRQLGQSVWLDFIDRPLILSGKLDRLIEDGLAGMTSNPTIFHKAITKGDGYEALIAQAPPSESDSSVFERIQVRDVADACDRFRSLWDSSSGTDGFVSIEVEPDAANDTARSIEAARRLWRAVARPNLMVKIPGTREGIPAIETCLAEGININITLLFSTARYDEVSNAYLAALERRFARNERIDRMASVASFFVSRVDTKIDK